ncbi:MAG: VWA domain-containing protein, partial [Planctomycetota bacterium]
MLFANTLMLIGLFAALIPIIIHLLNRRAAETVDWGAMQFLLGSVVSRSRRMLLEEMLLLALRCLLLALVALAMALPFVPAGSTVPWGLMLPAVLLGAALLGAGTVLWDARGWRWGLIAAGALLLLLAVTAGLAERWIQSHRWQTSGGGRDVAIVIDGSASMLLEVDGKTNFDRAVEEARTLAATLGPEDAASVIVAGLRPRLVLASPVVSRKQVAGAIARARPTGGRMAVREALATAAATLEEGGNPNRTIILITDGQAAGWKSSGEVNWELLAETFQG